MNQVNLGFINRFFVCFAVLPLFSFARDGLSGGRLKMRPDQLDRFAQGNAAMADPVFFFDAEFRQRSCPVPVNRKPDRAKSPSPRRANRISSFAYTFDCFHPAIDRQRHHTAETRAAHCRRHGGHLVQQLVHIVVIGGVFTGKAAGKHSGLAVQRIDLQTVSSARLAIWAIRLQTNAFLLALLPVVAVFFNFGQVVAFYG